MFLRFRTVLQWVLFSSALLGLAEGSYAAPFALGDIFVSLGGVGRVEHRNAAGALLEVLPTTNAMGTAFDAAGNLYVTESSSNVVAKLSGPGDPHAAAMFGSGYGQPGSVVVAKDGHVLVGNGFNGILEFDASGNLIKNILPGGSVFSFDLAADQETILYSVESDEIRKASRTTGSDTGVFGTAPNFLFALRILPDGGIVVGTTQNVLRFSSTGAIVGTFDVTGADQFLGVALAPDALSFVTGTEIGTLYRFNVATGTNLDNQTQTIEVCQPLGLCLFDVSIFAGVAAGAAAPRIAEPAPILLLSVSLLAVFVRGRTRAFHA